jgi:sugar lactone lactonase YvrE
LLPNGLAVDSAGDLYVSDPGNFIVRKVPSSGGATSATLFAGALNGNGCSDGDRLTFASFTSTRQLALDSADNVYVADTGCHSVKRIDQVTGAVTSLAGPNSAATVVCSTSGEGVGTNALFANPTGLAVDNLGSVYVSDADCNQIFKIATSDGNAVVLAGQWWSPGAANGVGAAATFSVPSSLAYSAGFLYVADTQNNLIRRVSTSTGAVTTVAGAAPPAAAATSQVDGLGTNARFKYPSGVAGGPDVLYVADTGGYIIRKIVLATGAVTTVAGVFNTIAFADGVATSATFYDPQAIACNSGGTIVYVADSGNNKVRKIAY